MTNDQFRGVVMKSGSAVIIGMLMYFFFLTDMAEHLSLGYKVVAALICIGSSLIALCMFVKCGCEEAGIWRSRKKCKGCLEKGG